VGPSIEEIIMSLGMIGRKVGMTRIFTEGGESVPVTVLDVSNNRVSQVKSNDTDGYAAVKSLMANAGVAESIKPFPVTLRRQV
jgi:large subunit ribosomal protein L3